MLNIIKRFISLFSCINYCHWKSNAFLAYSVQGINDLDLLFESQHKHQVEELFKLLGAVKVAPLAEKKYNYIDDWLVLDEQTGILVHFHVHYNLEIGESYIKNYVLPFSLKMLSSRVLDIDYKMYRSSCEWEFLCLLLRRVLKVQKNFLGKIKVGSIGRNTEEEIAWLRSNINPERFKKIVIENFDCETYDRLLFLIENTTKNCSEANYARKNVIKNLAPYRKYGLVMESLLRIVRKIQRLFKLLLTKLGIPLVNKKSLRPQGVIIAMVGHDGAGKTTIINEVKLSFGRKLSIVNVYFGHGASGQSCFLNFLKKTTRCIGFVESKVLKSRDLSDCFFAMGRALHKLYAAFLVKRASRNGSLVLCDRYPQIEQPKTNDGLYLIHLLDSKNVAKQFLAKIELAIFNYIVRIIAPDVIVKIIASPEIALKRKKDAILKDEIIKKSEQLNSIRYQGAKTVVTVDNSFDLLSFKIKVFNHIWSSVQRQCK